jgi:hypothetical protein
MNDYRPLTSEEIEVLKSNDCWAEDWTSINVSEDFKPNYMHRVMLYGEVNIGAFNKNVEVSQGFVKHSGINNATLRTNPGWLASAGRHRWLSSNRAPGCPSA